MTSPVTSYTEALAVIQGRLANVLQIRYEDFDDLCMFSPGLTGKFLGPAGVKRLGIEKFFDALSGAGLRIVLEEDPEQTAKMLKRIAENYNPRQANQARMRNSASRISGHLKARVYGYFLKEARKKRWVKTTKLERSEHARMMAMAGVRKRRKEQKRRARQRKLAHQARKVATANNGA